VDGQPAGLVLWQLFGTTNQILGGLTLLTVTLYLMRRRANFLYTLIPMVFMLATTIVAMVLKVGDFYRAGRHILLVMGVVILVLAFWLIVEGTLRWMKLRNGTAAIGEGVTAGS
jgi:carbon starvation protein